MLFAYQVEKLMANSMDPDQTAWMRGWSGSMLVANALCWFCCDVAHLMSQDVFVQAV
jgi:hypothetical protein